MRAYARSMYQDASGRWCATMETAPCPLCGETSLLTVSYGGVVAWKNGRLVQDAFPGMSAERRELLISGTHPECWADAFGDEGGKEGA